MLDLITSIDDQIFYFINERVKKSFIIDNIMIFLAEYAQFIFPLILIILWLVNKKKSRIAVLQTTLAFGFSFSLIKIIKMFSYRDRPFISHLDINQLVEHSINSSFPSNHATSAFVIAVTVFLFYKRLGTICLMISFGIAFSRIWVGVHYPIDVIVGIILGTLISVLFHWCFGKFAKHLNRFTLFQGKV
ncbi:undecaprenyl-diphosphatase [Bacillus thuringiensis]|uniref:Undecaprenyl-diphosphatase n=1 Tax=Bacillus thuringiensis TaxID=1428 RepID=A0A9X6TNL1_BACTU|nr:undecaprenyl-diphosphatase [Bacillus thuringiensis]PEA89593.1 undecaprenyl-diphosphatase [Bacillus thuringiensis]